MSPELSVVMPCLNEAETLAICINKANSFFERENVRGEVVIADNGSTDGSQKIAKSLHARVVDVPEKGYEYLAPPVITNHYRNGNKIIIEFIGYNDEYYFDGYNVYVSDSSLNRNAVANYKPVQVEDYPSSTPSFPIPPPCAHRSNRLPRPPSHRPMHQQSLH